MDDKPLVKIPCGFVFVWLLFLQRIVTGSKYIFVLLYNSVIALNIIKIKDLKL